jgi:signal transduction histidine kinase
VVVLLDSREKFKKIILTSYIFSSAMFLFCFTPLVVKDVVLKLNIKYYPEWGVLYPIYALMYCVFAGYGNGLLYVALRKSSGERRNQLRYFFAGTALGFAGGISLFFLILNIKVPPFASVLICIYPIVTSYAIVRHHLMDIEVVIKKTLVFTGLLAAIFTMLVVPTLLIQELLFRGAGTGGRMVGLIISGIIIILTMRRIKTFLINITDKYLFQKKYDYKQVLKSFIDEVLTILSLDDAIQRTLELLDKTLHPERAAVLLFNRYEDKYVSYKTMGYDEEIIFDSSSKITKALKAVKGIISIEDEKNSKVDELKNGLLETGAHLAIPLMLHNDLIGIMMLGKKRSDENYTQDDLDILIDLARTEAIAIANAQLFAEAAQNERRAAVGTLAAGINHEIGDPLNMINTNIQDYMISLEKGSYSDKNLDYAINEAKNVMNICLEQTARINDITKKLSNFARPSKDLKTEPVDIREQVEETISVIGHELEMEHISIAMDIDKNLPQIMADKRQIQQIFFTILRSAGQATKESGTIVIKAYNEKDTNIIIEIVCNGCTVWFDLSIVRQLVWRNRGNMRVTSGESEDAKFIIIFSATK